MTSLGTHLVNNGRLSFFSRCKGKDVSDLEWVSYSWSYLMYLHTLVQVGMVIREIFALLASSGSLPSDHVHQVMLSLAEKYFSKISLSKLKGRICFGIFQTETRNMFFDVKAQLVTVATASSYSCSWLASSKSLLLVTRKRIC